MEKKKLYILQEINPAEITAKDYTNYRHFSQLVDDLKIRELPAAIIDFINDNINMVNHAIIKKFNVSAVIKGAEKAILRLLEKQLKIVLKNHYRNMWVALGMAVFGVPIGAVWGLMNGNMGMTGFGFGIGMIIGLAYGTFLDKKAATEGRQINLEPKF